MRFLMLLMLSRDAYDGLPTAEPTTTAAITAFNDTLQRAGVLLALDGLFPPLARISFSSGKANVTNGPFTEAKAVIGRYWIIQSRSQEEAIEWARRCPAADNEVIEIRQVQEF